MIQYQNISDPVEQLDFEDRIVTIACAVCAVALVVMAFVGWL